MVVGLGNPGREYENTPHNVGFDAVDVVAGRFSGVFRASRRFGARRCQARIGDEPVWLVKPELFMNRSGRPVADLLSYFGLTAGDLAVVTDDADLPLGRIRVRVGGSSGGHKGVQSVLDAVPDAGFARVRIGVGRRADAGGLVRHVLTPFAGDDLETVRGAVRRAADAVECGVADGWAAAMNRFNGNAEVAERAERVAGTGLRKDG